MRPFSLAIISIVSVVAHTQFAAAADMPAKAPPPAPQAGGSFWAEAEYLYWQIKGDKLPALVTTGPDTLLATAGVLGAPGTSVLFGQSTVNQDWRSGVRVRAGYWFDPGKTMGIEAHFFGLENASTDFFASSSTTPVLARPFFNTIPMPRIRSWLPFPASRPDKCPSAKPRICLVLALRFASGFVRPAPSVPSPASSVIGICV